MTQKKNKTTWLITVTDTIGMAIIVLFTVMIIPVRVDLAAGLASTSLVVFSVAALLLTCIVLVSKSRSRFAITAVVVAALGMLIPQLAFSAAASRTQTALTFDPRSYIHFSGTTDISPSRMLSYDTVDGLKQKIALYEPLGQSNKKLVVLLHGGGWRYGNHLETGMWPGLLTQAGYTVASVQYRLSSDTYHSWLETPRDVHDALMTLRADAASLKIEQIHLMGQSAGGHLALLEAYRANQVTSVISLYAPVDLELDFKTSRDISAEIDFIGGPPSQFPARYAELSPIAAVTTASPRTLLVHGKSDDLVSYKQAQRLRDRLNRHRVDNELVLLPLTGHSFDNQRGGFATQITAQKVLRFLSR